MATPARSSALGQQTPTNMHKPKSSVTRFEAGSAGGRSMDDDSKTAVKVVVRVRPPLKPSDPGFDLIPQRFRENTCEVLSPTNLSIQSSQGKKLFLFDRVFDENTTQEGIWNYLSDSVTSFVKGYNVSIMAYGQSGAGKSFTMGTSGPEDQDDSDIKGIVPRAAQALFAKLNEPSERPSGIQTPKRYSTHSLPTLGGLKSERNSGAKNWELKASYVEIYNETVRDLLVDETVPSSDRASIVIREDPKGRIFLTGLHQIPINSVDDLLTALNFGSSIRQTDATNINARSSRSHAVFTLNLIQRKTDDDTPGTPTTKHQKRSSVSVDGPPGPETVAVIDSKLNFVDLAGSERLKNTGATGDRAKEGISINAGLASLGKVISQLSSKSPSAHISYRDSRLTRLLQDSLGGNAKTYMVACVTPAQFHLSETLNTVTYAQRARAIQSKPEIQLTHEDSDKQATIDRLKAEVSFLRDQVKNSDPSDRRAIAASKRPENARDREADMQTQLLDMQENYSALSQRHAKLIAELSRAKEDDDADIVLVDDSVGENAAERIKRSNSFAEAVEQMVLEYEKTIQTLESSLTKNRASLSKSENSLLEKENRIAHMESVQQQLQARIQKALDRESNNEAYTRELESRMEGSTSGEERSSAQIAELRREVTRLRESECNGEEYISTLEERLAEAEQDQETMQRELDRLEHIVERQRSIGRLDNLLGELDGMAKATPQNDMHASKISKRKQANGVHHSETPDESDSEHGSALSSRRQSQHQRNGSEMTLLGPHATTRDAAHDEVIADKVDALTQELFDLRSEHEANLNDYDNLQQKYRTALETLAKMEYGKERTSVDGPSSFLSDPLMRGEEKVESPTGQSSSPRSVSAELSSRVTSSIITGKEEDKTDIGSDTERTSFMGDSVLLDDLDSRYAPSPSPEQYEMQQEMEMLKRLNAEKDVSVAELTNTYKTLAQRHEETLKQMKILKQDAAKARDMRDMRDLRPASPALGKPNFRRKSEDVLGGMGTDRASRSFAALKNIALDNFDSKPEIRQRFESNLNSIMTEIHGRYERVQALETELTNLRKEMESKQAIITGLTRERSSMMVTSEADWSIVGQMRQQLVDSENQIKSLQEQHATKEKDYQEQIHQLKSSLDSYQDDNARLSTPNGERWASMPGNFPETPAEGPTPTRDLDDDLSTTPGAPRSVELAGDDAAEISRLQNALVESESKHKTALKSMQASEEKLRKTIADLKESMQKAHEQHTDYCTLQANHQSLQTQHKDLEDRHSSMQKDLEALESQHESIKKEHLAAIAAVTAGMEIERTKHKDAVDVLQQQVDKYKSATDDHVAKLEQMQGDYAKISKQVDEDSKSRELLSRELNMRKELVDNLENQLEVHKNAIKIHQESLESLRVQHVEDLDAMKESMAKAEKEASERHIQLANNHEVAIRDLQSELARFEGQHKEILRSASSALGCETDADNLGSHIKGITEENKELQARLVETNAELTKVQEELKAALENMEMLEGQVNELKTINEEAILNLEKVSERELKSSRLVEELEEQLNSTFDSQKANNHRMSAIHDETVQARAQLERDLEEQKLKNAMLEHQISKLDRHSLNSNGSNKSNHDSHSPEGGARQNRLSEAPTALPTPPPSIPLPPLPGNTPRDSAASILERATSPTGRMSPPASTDNNLNQLVEEQEARIRTIEKHLYAEKQLTATLEEALVDLETSANRTKSEADTWRKKCTGLEDELISLRKEKTSSRASLQQVEEEREMRKRAEQARQALEQRMMELNAAKKKKRSTLNCF
ncbi:Hypothetical protein R9X50_00736200 [Acrodontium crateriforme]|uniref:Kinesin motor domain-containing protein n=1 Tax=Acrodontium crateriforme TaxID=150365 RepID=A0AAQ3RC61_9PEZI|nr:Hypothetical protein R9X50_00736200 [Acrodontium crateriforme]